MPECGNGKVETGEQCDDGNQTADDGCEPDCTKTAPTTCGNGTLDTGEECDDGNQTAADGCENNCTKTPGNKCGNGAVDPGEQCDDGNLIAADGCENNCTQTTVCGDGTVDANEECDDGNSIPGDGCEPNCKNSPTETEIVECATLPATSGRTCDVTAGSDSLLIKGDILTPGRVFRGGQVLVDGAGKITCVDCDCSAAAAGATVVSCPDSVVSPGLINAHDHITYANNQPYVAPAELADERFEHRHDWRKGLRGHTKITTSGGASQAVVSHLELRFVMGGATSIVGSGQAPGLLRNLDKASGQEGLNKPAVDYETFPLGDSGGTLISDGCGYAKFVESSLDSYVPHIAEGIDTEAHNEFLCVEGLNGGTDLVKPNAAFIHGVAALPPDTAWMALDGTKLIWSPRTNVSLYGDTAPVTLYARSGAIIALGTDWTPSGSGNMLRELQCVSDLNATYYDNFFSDEDIWKMATLNAARAAAMEDVIGLLAPGRFADIAIFRKNANVDFRAVIEAQPGDIALVLRTGDALFGDDNLVDALGNVGGCEAVDVCGVAKKACVSETNNTLAALRAAGDQYVDLFYCNGVPANEPTCLPARTVSVKGSTVYDGLAKDGDMDGDGIGDDVDNCPRVFNPVRPMDNGKQPDFDLDGVGDVCDPCPLSTEGGNCPVFSPGDYDMDGAGDDVDNCFAVPNPLQENQDSDEFGDACDKCPEAAGACPTTIYDVKKRLVATGDIVKISDVLVTGIGTNGYFVQVKEGDAGFVTADFSGVFVYAGSAGPFPAVGDRIDLDPVRVDEYYGQIQLNNATFVVKGQGEAGPAPVVVADPTEIATGGARVSALESVVVAVENVAVTSENPDAPDDYQEFAVTGDLRIDDFIYLVDPRPFLGDDFLSISGVLAFRNSNSKILPRSADDLVEASPTPRLAGIEPDFGYVREGTTGVQTIPQPMMLKLLRPMATDTVVSITSDSADLVVVGGGVTVLAGATEAAIVFDGVTPNAAVTLNSSLNGTDATAQVRVLGATEQPTALALAPTPTTVLPDETKTLTVSIDLPAPAGGLTVTLAATPSDAGTLPATVDILENAMEATFDFVAGSTEQTVTIDATLDTLTASAEVAISAIQPGVSLVINEVDYDQMGEDLNEFVEIYNPTASAASLAGLKLVFVNGSNSTEDSSVDLSSVGALPAGGYLVVASTTVTVAAGALRADLPAASNNIQNGAPDGVALIDTTAGTVVDALSYEGGITACTLTGVTGTVSLVEGTVLPTTIADSNAVEGSLIREPNGADTDDAAADWKFTSQLTPGEANVLVP